MSGISADEADVGIYEDMGETGSLGSHSISSTPSQSQNKKMCGSGNEILSPVSALASPIVRDMDTSADNSSSPKIVVDTSGRPYEYENEEFENDSEHELKPGAKPVAVDESKINKDIRESVTVKADSPSEVPEMQVPLSVSVVVAPVTASALEESAQQSHVEVDAEAREKVATAAVRSHQLALLKQKKISAPRASAMLTLSPGVGSGGVADDSTSNAAILRAASNSNASAPVSISVSSAEVAGNAFENEKKKKTKKKDAAAATKSMQLTPSELELFGIKDGDPLKPIAVSVPGTSTQPPKKNAVVSSGYGNAPSKNKVKAGAMATSGKDKERPVVPPLNMNSNSAGAGAVPETKTSASSRSPSATDTEPKGSPTFPSSSRSILANEWEADANGYSLNDFEATEVEAEVRAEVGNNDRPWVGGAGERVYHQPAQQVVNSGRQGQGQGHLNQAKGKKKKNVNVNVNGSMDSSPHPSLTPTNFSSPKTTKSINIKHRPGQDQRENDSDYDSREVPILPKNREHEHFSRRDVPHKPSHHNVVAPAGQQLHGTSYVSADMVRSHGIDTGRRSQDNSARGESKSKGRGRGGGGSGKEKDISYQGGKYQYHYYQGQDQQTNKPAFAINGPSSNYDQKSGLFSTYETEAIRQSRKETYLIANMEKKLRDLEERERVRELVEMRARAERSRLQAQDEKRKLMVIQRQQDAYLLQQQLLLFQQQAVAQKQQYQYAGPVSDGSQPHTHRSPIKRGQSHSRHSSPGSDADNRESDGDQDENEYTDDDLARDHDHDEFFNDQHNHGKGYSNNSNSNNQYEDHNHGADPSEREAQQQMRQEHLADQQRLRQEHVQRQRQYARERREKIQLERVLAKQEAAAAAARVRQIKQEEENLMYLRQKAAVDAAGSHIELLNFKNRHVLPGRSRKNTNAQNKEGNLRQGAKGKNNNNNNNNASNYSNSNSNNKTPRGNGNDKVHHDDDDDNDYEYDDVMGGDDNDECESLNEYDREGNSTYNAVNNQNNQNNHMLPTVQGGGELSEADGDADYTSGVGHVVSVLLPEQSEFSEGGGHQATDDYAYIPHKPHAPVHIPRQAQKQNQLHIYANANENVHTKQSNGLSNISAAASSYKHSSSPKAKYGPIRRGGVGIHKNSQPKDQYVDVDVVGGDGIHGSYIHPNVGHTPRQPSNSKPTVSGGRKAKGGVVRITGVMGSGSKGVGEDPTKNGTNTNTKNMPSFVSSRQQQYEGSTPHKKKTASVTHQNQIHNPTGMQKGNPGRTGPLNLKQGPRQQGFTYDAMQEGNYHHKREDYVDRRESDHHLGRDDDEHDMYDSHGKYQNFFGAGYNNSYNHDGHVIDKGQGGSSVAVGINDDGSVVISNHSKDDAHAGMIGVNGYGSVGIGAEGSITGIGVNSLPGKHSQEGSNVGIISHSGLENGGDSLTAYNSLLDYYIPEVVLGDHDGCDEINGKFELGPMDEKPDAVLNGPYHEGQGGNGGEFHLLGMTGNTFDDSNDDTGPVGYLNEIGNPPMSVQVSDWGGADDDE